MSLQAADPHINAVVQASAGSGKTYLLVTRIVRLLLAGAAPDAILAITFTRKAAAEIQTRVRERLWDLACAEGGALDEALQGLGVTTVDTALRARALDLYETLLRAPTPLRATTFHAFCQDLLRRFPLEGGVPPGFALTEETGTLADEAWEALIDEATRAPEGEIAAALDALLDLCEGMDNAQSALRGFLARRGDWWAYRQAHTNHEDEDDEAAVAALLADLAEELEIDPEASDDPAQTLMDPAVDADLETYARLLGARPNPTQQKQLHELAQARQAQDPQSREAALRRALLTAKGEPRKLNPSQALKARIGEDGAERLLALHADLCAHLQGVEERRRRHLNYRRHRAWLTAGTALLRHYRRLKEERRLLDFDDLEWRAYRLLNADDENALWVQYKLDQRIEHILVDEFQDTNPTQWRLLLPLLQEMAAGERQGRSVFLVGDVKQSIYGFRRAQPALMETARHWLEAHLEARTFPLDSSWRSSPAVITLVNRVFADETLAAHMDFHPHQTHRKTLYGQVRCLPLVDADPETDEAPPEGGLRDPLERPRPANEDQRPLQEARHIAEALRELLERPLLVGEAHEARPLTPGDIMILLRKRTHAPAIERALRAAGIPYQGTHRGTLLRCREVEDLVDLLRFLHTPGDDLALAGVLRSPLFAAEDLDLQDLADQSEGDWYDRLLALGPRRPAHSPLGRAARLLPAWREQVGRLPVHDLLDRIYHEGDVIGRFEAAFPEHLRARVRGNLQRLLELALEIDSGRYPSIGRFLERLAHWREEADAEEAPDESVDLPEDDGGRVRLLTIHAAKGLEAPVVILADAANAQTRSERYPTLVDWPPEAPHPRALRLVPSDKHQDQPTRRRLEALKREQAREEANLLYVALTRAQQILLVSGHLGRKRKDADGTWYGHVARALGEAGEITHGTLPVVPAQETAPPEPPPPLPAHLAHPAEEAAPEGETTLAPSTQEAPEWDDEDARLRGTTLHLLLEYYPREDEATLLARAARHAHRHPDDPELGRWLEEVRRLYAEPRLRPYLRPGPEVTVFDEAPLQYRAGDTLVQGVVDRLLVGPEEVVVLDYKTHREARPDNLARLAAPYLPQLAHYTAAARRLWPDKRVRGVLLFTRPGLIYEMDPTVLQHRIEEIDP